MYIYNADPHFPAGFMDVVEIKRSNDVFRLIYDTKGRFVLHRIDENEKKYKLCRVKDVSLTNKAVPYLVTHDGRTIRYPDPAVRVNDTIKVDIDSGKILADGIIRFDVGNSVMITKGRNTGRVGTLTHIENHPGSFNIAIVRDASGSSFSTRAENVFVIGQGNTPAVSLPKGNGIKLSILEEREMIQRKTKKE
jgi:ribosomal protein S4E